MANSKDVVVTGVSTGIGWGTTKVLVSKGFRVFGSVRKQADADRLQREFGNGFVPLMMDITDADAVHQAAQKVGSMIGDRNLVGLVNNAGIVVSGPLLYLRLSEYRRQLEVNTISPLVVIQKACGTDAVVCSASWTRDKRATDDSTRDSCGQLRERCIRFADDMRRPLRCRHRQRRPLGNGQKGGCKIVRGLGSDRFKEPRAFSGLRRLSHGLTGRRFLPGEAGGTPGGLRLR